MQPEKLLTAAQMRRLDEATINEIGIPGIVLMENASRGVFEVIRNEFELLDGKRALVLCGKGNNGGDGFAVARHLLGAGAKPDVVLFAKKSQIGGDAKTNLDVCLNLGIPVAEIMDPKRMSVLRRKVEAADFIVDALLGTGVKGPVKSLFLKIIQIINRAECPVFSVDVPSGLSVDDGRVYNDAVNADHTITFGAAKTGMFVHPGASRAGSVYIVDIGIPARLLDESECGAYLTSRRYIKSILKEMPETAHKGNCGKLLIIGGSRGMSGSVTLAGMSAMRTGAGLVYLAAPRCLVNIVERKFTEGVTLPQEEDSRGRFSGAAVDSIVKKLADVDAAVIGPGMSVSDDTCELLEAVIKKSKAPLLIDADGLTCLSRNPVALKKAKGPVVITPHSGEMGRLCGRSAAQVEEARLETAAEFAREYGVITLLKGAGTIIAAPDGKVFINSTGNSGMATAGSGDVLSGMTGALAAGGMPLIDAAVCGAFLHGMSGDLAADEKGSRSVIASDIVENISKSILEISSLKV